MCGRFTLRLNTAEVAERFDALDRGIRHPPRYNVAPEDERGILILGWAKDERRRALAEARWGLLPHWVDDPADFPRLINARSETTAEKPAFRDAFGARHCLVPADGFYEWLGTDGRKQPFFLHRKDDASFAFAGIWDRWRGQGRTVISCAILTCPPDEVVAPVHDRMPVILPEDRYDRWLRPDSGEGDPRELLVPYPDAAERFEAVPVSTRVNDPTYDAPELVEPLQAEG